MVSGLRTDIALYRYLLQAMGRSSHLAMPTGTVFFRVNAQLTLWLSPLIVPVVCVPCDVTLCAGVHVSSRWPWGRPRYVASPADAVALLLELTG